MRNFSDESSSISEESSLGVGAHLHLTETEWRLRVRQAWLIGLLERTMQLGFGYGRIKNMIFNSYSLTEAGQKYAVESHSVELPKLRSNMKSAQVQTDSSPDATKHTRGTHLLPELLSSKDNWYIIEQNEDYHFPGKFRLPYPHRLGFVPDITTLSFYVKDDEHFLFNDIQIGKGKSRAARKVLLLVDGKEEELYYRIAPCGGAKYCPIEGCSFTISTREHRGCPDHPDSHLTLQECQVEFVYVWPEKDEDKRRWLSGILRRGTMEADNLHNHPLHGSTKVPSKVVHDIQQALKLDPTLKTHDLMTGEYPIIIIS